MTRVTPRAQRHVDRNGDPLDGLVNMFDLGIVLAVAFLLAALQSVNLTELLTDQVTIVRKTASGQTVVIKRNDKLRTLKPSDQKAQGTGERVGSVYRLPDGRLVYDTTTGSTSPGRPGTSERTGSERTGSAQQRTSP